MSMSDRYADFLALSSTLTGFSVFRLKGTGQGEPYLATLADVVGGSVVDELLSAHRAAIDEAAGDEAALARALRLRVLSDDKLGPLARNLIKLWYVGTWYVLPPDWRERYAASDKDGTFVVSPEAYTEGLLWPCVGANPSGAKPFGYAMWAKPPRIETA